MAASYTSLVGIAVDGKYEIRRILGAGGMGVVCEALHLDLHKRVAIKLIDKSMKESELIVTRFRREAKAAGQIKSDHIVDVFDVGADARVGLYMVMEYLTGEDLQNRLERDGKVDVKTGVMIAHQIARGLAKAHEAGVIHRDLKPANVYLTQRDNGQMLVKLLDFGVSKLLDQDPGSARITGSGAPIGTPLYMSPEQAEGKDDVDARADIWSLGAVMYEALAGVTPFQDRGSYHGTIVGILTSRPKLLNDVAPWIPPELANVIDAMLVHDRDARIPNAMTAAQRLLAAFPSVLPDGTGKYTAVIVPQTTTAVDAIGDTEVFTGASIPGRRNKSEPPPRSMSDRPPPPTTMSEVGGETGVASNHDFRKGPASGPPPSRRVDPDGEFDRTVKTSHPSGGPRTAPFLPSSPSSSQAPPTPSNMEPVSVKSDSIIPQPRVQKSTVRMENAPKRGRPLLWIFFLVLLVAVGGFFIGRRTNTPIPWLRPATQPAPQPAPTTTPTPTPSATPSLTPSASAPPPHVADPIPSTRPSSVPSSFTRRKPPPTKKPEAPSTPTTPPPVDDLPSTPND